jgi:hypothetical protein
MHIIRIINAQYYGINSVLNANNQIFNSLKLYLFCVKP